MKENVKVKVHAAKPEREKSARNTIKQAFVDIGLKLRNARAVTGRVVAVTVRRIMGFRPC